MIFTDTHSHQYADQFKGDIDEAMKRATNEGVERIFLPNIDRGSIDKMLKLCANYPQQCFPMMGLHPCSVQENWEEELAIAEDWLFNRQDEIKFYAVGEIGIDLHWDKSTLPIQIIAFERQIAWAKALDLPIVIHARESFDEIFEVVDRLNDEKLRGIFHCFTGTPEQAQRVINYGDFMVGIGGVLTFKKAGLDRTLEEIDLKHVVLETDAPYLAPVPYRGKRNESSYVRLIAEKVSEVRGISLEEVARITTENSKTMFRI